MGRWTSTAEMAATCRVVRSVEELRRQAGSFLRRGVSAESVGARAIWLGMVTIAPGGRTRAHFHEGHESAFYVLSGEFELWYGEDLREHEVARAGDYLYIPAGVSHVAVNRSQTEPVVVVGGRTDPSEQESVVLQPELDARVPGSTTATGSGRAPSCSHAIQLTRTAKRRIMAASKPSWKSWDSTLPEPLQPRRASRSRSPGCACAATGPISPVTSPRTRTAPWRIPSVRSGTTSRRSRATSRRDWWPWPTSAVSSGRWATSTG